MLKRNEWRKVVLIAMLICGIVRTPAYAQEIIVTHRISAVLANEAVEAAVSFCASQGYTESAAVVDIDGVALATLRGDGAGVHTPDSAIDKAYTSVSLKSDTLTLVSTVQDQLTPAGPFSKLPHLLLFGGGVTIKLGAEVIGAIGAAGAPGGKLDDACARAGLDKIKDRLK
jgi:uncharacterized protein GlcG (DUF336 family)